MIGGSEKRKRQLAFELQNSRVCDKRSNVRCCSRVYVLICSQSHGRTLGEIE